MYKYNFSGETKHTTFFMYEDYEGAHVKSFVSSNLKDEVDVDLRQRLNYVFREQFDIETSENNIPIHIVEIACNSIDGYFR
jgi:hypothetical protein